MTASGYGAVDKVNRAGDTMTGALTVPTLTVTGALNAAGVTDWVNVVALGADPTGVSDSTTALQAAINAAIPTGKIVYLPAGKYLFTTLHVGAVGGGALRMVGAGPGGSSNKGTHLVSSSSSSLITFSGAVAGLEISHLAIENQGTSHILDTPVAGYYHDLTLTLTSGNTGGSAVNVAGSSLLINAKFERITFNSNAASRAAPIVSLVSTGSGNISNNTFEKCFFNNVNGADTSQFMIYAACSGTAGGGGGGHFATVIRDCYFEKPYGGAVKSLSGQGLVVENCMFWDTFTSPPTAGNSLVYIGTFPSGSISEAARIISCGRNRAGGVDGVATWDVYCESTVNGVTVNGYTVYEAPSGAGSGTAPAYFNFNGCTNVTLSGNQQAVTGNASSGVIITNPPSPVAGNAVLVAGTKTVSTPLVTANSVIQLTSQIDGGTPGWLRVSARTAATSFTITSSSATDTSTVGWQIVEPG